MRKRSTSHLVWFLVGFLVLTAPPPLAAQGGGTTHGDLFGDLVHVLRDRATGQPILQKRLIEYPEDITDWGYCPIPVDVFGLEIPFATLSCDVDPTQLDRLVELDYFGRLSGGRAKERNLRMHFDEVIVRIKGSEAVDIDPDGRLKTGTACTPGGPCEVWKTVDAPFENLGIYYRLMKYGHVQTDPLEEDVDAHGDPEQGTVYHPALAAEDWPKFRGLLTALLPRASAAQCFSGTSFVTACAEPVPLTTEDFVRAASMLAGAADKHGKITLDLVQYMNRLLRIPAAGTQPTLPVLIRDENGVIAPAPSGLPAPADERFLDYANAAYERTARFSQPFVALVGPGPNWVETAGVTVLDFLRFINGAATPLAGAAAFVANGHDALRAVEFIHEYAVPADIRAPGAFTTTTVSPQTIGTSTAAQPVALSATVVNAVSVSGGTVTFSVQTGAGAPVGASVDGVVANGTATAIFILPPATAPGDLMILGAYNGAPGFAPSNGTALLTVTSTPTSPCAGSISPPTATAPPEGGTGSVALAIAEGCPAWTAVPSGTWIVPETTSGTGSATIDYEVAPNLTGVTRTGYLTIAGQMLTITQASMPLMTTSDFNGDGKSDIVWQHRDGPVVIWFMDGTTPIGSHELSAPADIDWRVVAVADFNRDGSADLLWQHRVTGGLFVWLMQGVTPVSAQPMGETVTDINWVVVGVDDLNDDGWRDLVWQHRATGAIAVWLLNGLTHQSVVMIPETAPDVSWAIEAVADFNVDEQGDLVWQNRRTGELFLWQLSNTTVTGVQPLTPASVSDLDWQIAGAADMNRDGQMDLVWQHATGSVLVWFMNGATATQLAFVTTTIDPNWKVVAVR